MIKRRAITAAMKLEFVRVWGEFPCLDCALEYTGRDEPSPRYPWRSIQLDHNLALIDGGKHDATNLVPRCLRHHKLKSAREHIANCKAKRLKAGGRKRKGPPMRSRGFDKTIGKRMNGEVYKR